MVKTSSSATASDFDAARVLAKSDGRGLYEHILDCLEVYRALCSALPAIPSILEQADFFDLLFCSVYFHDWGKAHIEFQKVLKGIKNEWSHGRHEIYSAPFVEMLSLPAEARELISQAVLGHHKDFETLWAYLYSEEEIEEHRRNARLGISPLDFTKNLLHKMDVKYLLQLKKHFHACYGAYAAHGGCDGRVPGIALAPVDYSASEHPVRKYVKPLLARNAGPEDKLYWRQMLLLGATKLCDHMGSAGIAEIVRLVPGDLDFLNKLEGSWYSHQKECGGVEGSLFLMAPTGSGKTEAALGWVRKQLRAGHQGRVFYVLPYTASINAMHRRLTRDFEPEAAHPGATRVVGVLHGKMSQYLAQYFEDLGDDPRESLLQLNRVKELHRQMVHPIKVVTPFQILKHCYGVRGFEMGLTELAGAMLVFDEIHAYDMQTFAQIVSSLEWLSRHLATKAMIMTATLPSYMLEELRRAVGPCSTVHADPALLDAFTRHRVVLVEGGIFKQVPSIREYLREGRRVIVVCNTVANAQAVFLDLRGEVDERESVLLHSRFNARDRLEQERMLMDENVKLLVGTQAIEVSLDIDFDLMFTEPAPLDALIQRFGRVNRRRRKGICPVFVCREGGEHDGYIYPLKVVEVTLKVLDGVSVLREADLGEMLDKVYPDWPDRETYRATRDGFRASLDRLKPFMSFKEEESAFYEKFSGVSVIPACFRSAYEEHMASFELLEAEKLFIGIQIGMFHKLLKRGLLERSAAVVEQGGKFREHRYLVVRCRYDPKLGLLEEEEVPAEMSAAVF